jgi:hypothetical protein
MRFLLFAITCVISLSSFSQLRKASIEDLKFMSGTWTLKHQWGDMEEFWSSPMGNNMMCTYRCVKDGKIVFYEFIVIEQSDSVPVLKLRHFNPGSIGWEEKQNPWHYPLVKLEKNMAVFERPDKKTRLIYERKSDIELLSMLEREDKNGAWVKDTFEYKSIH